VGLFDAHDVARPAACPGTLGPQQVCGRPAQTLCAPTHKAPEKENKTKTQSDKPSKIRSKEQRNERRNERSNKETDNRTNEEEVTAKKPRPKEKRNTEAEAARKEGQQEEGENQK
jgi:hypothetical protein